MTDLPTAVTAEPTAIIDAAGRAGVSLTITGEAHLTGMRKLHRTVGDAIGAALPLAYTHGLAITITPAAIRQHVDDELRAMRAAEGSDHA